MRMNSDQVERARKMVFFRGSRARSSWRIMRGVMVTQNLRVYENEA